MITRSLFFTILICTFYLGCNKKNQDFLRIQISSEPVTLDPALAEDGVSLKILGNVMDGLVGYDGSGQLEKRLAKSIDISPSGTRYQIALRDEGVWSDGKPVTTQDFIDGITRSLSPTTGSKLADMLFPIKNAKAFHNGKAKAPDLGIKSQSGKLIIDLERPAPYFLQALTLSVAMPIRLDFLQDHEGRWLGMPTTGLYRIASYTAGKILLEPNLKHWKYTKKIKSAQFMIVHDESTAMNLFDHQQIDILTRVPSMDLSRLEKKKQLHRDPFLATFFIAFNQKKSPFNNRHYRQAVAHSIKKREIIAALGSGEFPARSWIPIGLEGFLPYQDVSSKFRDSIPEVKPISTIAAFDSSSRNSMIMEKIQNDLKKSIQMGLQLTQMDWKSYIQQLRTDPPPIYRFGWLAPFLDPLMHLQVFTSKNPNNFTHWSHAQYDRWVDEVASLPPGPKRLEKILKAQHLLIEEEAVVVPIYHYVQIHAVSSRIAGFRVNPFGVIPLNELSISP